MGEGVIDRQTKCQGQEEPSKISGLHLLWESPRALERPPRGPQASREGLSLPRPQHPELGRARSRATVITAECVSRCMKSEARGRDRQAEILALGPLCPQFTGCDGVGPGCRQPQ